MKWINVNGFVGLLNLHHVKRIYREGDEAIGLSIFSGVDLITYYDSKELREDEMATILSFLQSETSKILFLRNCIVDASEEEEWYEDDED